MLACHLRCFSGFAAPAPKGLRYLRWGGDGEAMTMDAKITKMDDKMKGL